MDMMLLKPVNIYLACGYTDMRKSIDGLATIVQQNFQLSPYEKDLFLFCGKRCDRIKALFWDEDGFLLLYKRLENGKFRWPRTQDEVMKLSEKQLHWLMDGLEINQPKAIKPSHPTRII